MAAVSRLRSSTAVSESNPELPERPLGLHLRPARRSRGRRPPLVPPHRSTTRARSRSAADSRAEPVPRPCADDDAGPVASAPGGSRGQFGEQPRRPGQAKGRNGPSRRRRRPVWLVLVERSPEGAEASRGPSGGAARRRGGRSFTRRPSGRVVVLCLPAPQATRGHRRPAARRRSQRVEVGVRRRVPRPARRCPTPPRRTRTPRGASAGRPATRPGVPRRGLGPAHVRRTVQAVSANGSSGRRPAGGVVTRVPVVTEPVRSAATAVRSVTSRTTTSTRPAVLGRPPVRPHRAGGAPAAGQHHPPGAPLDQPSVTRPAPTPPVPPVTSTVPAGGQCRWRPRSPGGGPSGGPADRTDAARPVLAAAGQHVGQPVHGLLGVHSAGRSTRPPHQPG